MDEIPLLFYDIGTRSASGEVDRGSCFNEIEAPFDATKSLVNPVHTLTQCTQKNQNLSQHLFERRHATLEIGNIELGSLLRGTNAPKHFKHHIVRLVSHCSVLIWLSPLHPNRSTV
jgi:hypothetical protein